ncbi:lipoyl amidotransferase LIPT1, mitochondrial-like isoform X2 [Crassostrea virginica]
MVHLCRQLRLSRAFLSAEICRFHKRSFSQKSSKRHQVYVSTSDDIYTNLALEEWLYEKEDFNQKSILLMWQNKPAVVIGRHQNPWLECSVPKLREHGIDLARRISGGGCVYHDLGNLNCSFLKTKKQYNRRQNLDLVVEAVTNRWGVDLQVNTREDIVLDGLYKISGTASKLGKNNTFHHFTLLHDVNEENLEMALESPMRIGVESKATDSKRSRIKNLSECDITIDFISLVEVIGQQFYKEAGGEITWIDPGDETLFPGVTEINKASKDWEWVFGKTPKFSIKRTFTSGELRTELSVSCHFEKGRIKTAEIMCDYRTPCVEEFTDRLQRELTGRRLHREDLHQTLNDYDLSQFDQKHSAVISWIIQSCVQALGTGV